MKKLTIISSILLVLIIILSACSQESTISVEEEIIGDPQKTAEQEKFKEVVKTAAAGTIAALATETPASVPPTLTSTPFPPFRDDFNQLLEDGWEWLHESKDGWNLHEKPDFLRVEVALDTKQVLVRNGPEGNFEITTRVLFTPYQNFQSAGLIIFQDDGHLLQLHRGFAYFPDAECCIGNALYYDKIDYDLGSPGDGYGIDPLSPAKTDEMDEAYLRKIA